MAELVSILIPAYNAQNWIADTIRSALAQTWPNKEIVVVDDGSSDNTLKIARTFESENVKVVTQKNKGACGARNKAYGIAQGSYIQWLDADDLLSPDKISLQLKRSGDGHTSKVLLTSAFGTFFFRHRKAKFEPNALWKDLSPVEWIIRKFTESVWMNPTTWLVSRRLAELAGPWDERLSSHGDDDGEYICRVVSAAERVKFVSGARCYYRIGNVESLGWTKGKSEEGLELLYLSHRLSFTHLLSLEDSERTRRACLRYLETWLQACYPEKPDLVTTVSNLFHELGGRLPSPTTSWKYYVIQKALGWKTARRVMSNWRKAKLLVCRNLDRLLYSIEKTSHNSG